VNRRAIACLSALLVIFQMMVASPAAALPKSVPGEDCAHAGTVHPWHQDDHCSDGRDVGHDGGSNHAGGHQCHCVHAVAHTPIAGDLLAVVEIRAESDVITGRLSGPTCAAPLFALLRPPD
jgi:hypothetical protein